MTKLKLQTKGEIRRLNRNAQIVEDYSNMVGVMSTNRIMIALADKYNLSVTCVRNVLVENNVYTSNRTAL